MSEAYSSADRVRDMQFHQLAEEHKEGERSTTTREIAQVQAKQNGDEDQWEEVDSSDNDGNSDDGNDDLAASAAPKDSDNICFSVYDKVKIKVDVTTEFPLDIKCTLLITDEDMIDYNEIKTRMDETETSR